MNRVVLATILLTCLLAAPAMAHGGGWTSDDGDADINIQVYPSNGAATYKGLTAAMHTWNALHKLYGHGPRFVLVDSKAKADLWVHFGTCSTPCGAGMYHWEPGLDELRVVQKYNYLPYMYNALVHELGHALGMAHHCKDGTATVMDICGNNPHYLTAHDRAYYKAL